MKDPEAPAHEFLKTHAIAGKTSARVVKMIVASMLRDGWRGAPIAVVVHGNDKYILDGHHRAFAARRADLPVRYRVVSKKS
jgi:ParB-like chromosome segregation protein Spo0J